MQKILKKTGIVSILESVMFLILGVVLIIKPETTMEFVSNILGIIFILMGIFNLIGYLKVKNNFLLFSSIICIAFGIISFLYMGVIASIFRIIIGAWIIYASIIRLSYGFKVKKVNFKIGIWCLVLALIMFIAGLYVVINPNSLVVSIGVIMIIYSVIDLIENIIIAKNLD